MGFCVHRWTIQKRWTDKQSFHAIQKCRKCNAWKRSDMPITVSGTLPINDVLGEPGLENSSSDESNPISVTDIDSDNGDIKR